MSGTPPRAQRRPLHERSGSHTNALAAIRVVPYSPPRPLSITSSHPSACEPFPSHLDRDHDRDRDSYRGKIAAHHPNHALGAAAPATLSRPLATARGLHVSGSNVPSHRRNRSSGHQTALTPDRAEAASPTSPTPSTRIDARDISHPYASSYAQGQEPPKPSTSSTLGIASPGGRPVSRRRNLITVNTGRGTFAVQPLSATRQGHGTAASSFQSPSLSLSLSTQSSFERLSDLFSSDGRPSTPLSTLPERTPSPCTSLESPTSRLLGGGDHVAGSSSSPWNYRLVGGLRKVAVTPDSKQNQARPQLQPHPRPLSSHPFTLLDTRPPAATERDTTPDEAPAAPDSPRSLLNKASFQSSQSASTASGETNYKVYGASSPAPANTTAPDTASLRAYSSSDDSETNFRILGRSSPAPSSPPPPSPGLSPERTFASDASYCLVLPDFSPAASSAAPGKIRQEFSQESLVVQPLQPVKRKYSFEGIALRTSRSRESFRTGSLTSINSIIGQEAIQAFLATPLVLRRPSDPSASASASIGPGADSRASPSTSLIAPNPPMQAHPHQWSSQLSTVPSESEGGSEPPVSRSVSPLSSGWRSSGYQGSHSRQMLSISSSLAAREEDSASQSQSQSDSLDRPQPALTRATTVRLVQDHDEHGDGLAELHDFYPPLNQRPSRRRLGSLLSSSSSDRNLHSSASSRSNSLNSVSIPTWARLYYGSGERKWLRQAASSDSMATDYYNDGGSRPSSSFRSGSPSTEHLSLNIYSPRRRPREVRPPPMAQAASDSGSVDNNHVPLRSVFRRQTSSIWSPHLARDQRASGYSIWEPPSIDWSTESGPLGRRNVQIVLFIVGFILPLSWMVGAVLPLPPKPQHDMIQRPSESALDVSSRLQSRTTRSNLAEDIAYHNTRWWRNLNRIMAVVGLLIIAVIVTLVVVGIKQGWGS
ncbi:hypothetical protein B0T11DRAFT_232441 [Plectosphaerella cucumerina]|uniref:Serine-rich protein n=1 Tax=Plectosphaerella cucumerina TaxID=40658 RepID=A0A8K0T6Z1_9PEZI|nr:hypothetical protein B0T11DRAFT_232441 [Plectosphaerella cucumerina]